jgi:hypothetical protein
VTTNGTASHPRGPEPAGVSAVLAVTLATISFFAMVIAGLGALSVATDADIISVRGLGQAPGAIGMLAAVVAFGLIEYAAVRIARPLYRSVWITAFATALVHLVVVALGALIAAGDAVAALAVAGDLVQGGASAVILAAAAIAGWGGVALRRTKAKHPTWPWEDDE